MRGLCYVEPSVFEGAIANVVNFLNRMMKVQIHRFPALLLCELGHADYQFLRISGESSGQIASTRHVN